MGYLWKGSFKDRMILEFISLSVMYDMRYNYMILSVQFWNRWNSKIVALIHPGHSLTLIHISILNMAGTNAFGTRIADDLSARVGRMQ